MYLFPIPPVVLLRRESRPNLTPLDLAEDNAGCLLDLLDDLGVSLGSIARSRASAVEPVHEASLVPPDAHSENHTPAHGASHTLHGAQAHEVAGTVRAAVRIIHGNRRGDVLDDLAVLHVLADDGLERAVGGGELRDDGEGLGGVDLAAGLVVRRVGVVGVLSAAVLVADAGLGALVADAAVDTVLGAGVGSDLGGDLVGFPDVELVAADALLFDVTLVIVSIFEIFEE